MRLRETVELGPESLRNRPNQQGKQETVWLG